MASRRPTRSSKPPVSPSSSSSRTDVDIDHLAGQMLATLGISKKSSLPSSSANNNNNNVRTTRSSSKDALSALATATTPVMKSRTVSSTSNVTSASASSRSRMSSTEAHPHATPLTAIRRPAMQAFSTSKRVPSSSSSALQKSPKTNNNALGPNASPGSLASRRKSSVPPPVSITSEEYSSLVSLLAAKDAQIASLETSLQESEERVSTLSSRNKELEKEASLVAAQLIVSPHTVGIPTSGSRKALVGRAKNNEDSLNASKREYEDMKKQYEMQENLLLGFQRENEKAMLEIDTLKRRERSLVEQLKKVYGPTFSADMDLPSSPSNSAEGALPASITRNSLSSPLPTILSPEKREIGQVDSRALMEQLLLVQNLVQRFEKRLISRETELIKLEEDARQKSRVAEELFVSAAA